MSFQALELNRVGYSEAAIKGQVNNIVASNSSKNDGNPAKIAGFITEKFEKPSERLNC